MSRIYEGSVAVVAVQVSCGRLQVHAVQMRKA